MDNRFSLIDKIDIAKFVLVILLAFSLGIGLILFAVIGNKKPITFHDLYPGLAAITAGCLMVGIAYCAHRVNKSQASTTELEKSCYSRVEIHCVAKWQLVNGSIEILIHPLDTPLELTKVVFEAVEIQSIIETDTENKNRYP